jgi:hypothetical protein
MWGWCAEFFVYNSQCRVHTTIPQKPCLPERKAGGKGKKERRKEGRKEGRREGRREGSKEGRKERREGKGGKGEGREEGRKEGRKAGLELIFQCGKLSTIAFSICTI